MTPLFQQPDEAGVALPGAWSRRAHQSVVPAQQVTTRRRAATGRPRRASDPATAPARLAVGDEAAVSAALPTLGWDDLDAVEQTILMVAAQERTLKHACASWSGQPGRTSDIELTRSAAQTQYHRGLIGFYRVDDGYPDLGSKDLATVFGSHSYWDVCHVNSGRVGMFLTSAGEDTVLGP